MSRWLAVALGLAARAVVVVIAAEPPPPKPTFYYGSVEGLTSAGILHHFTLHGSRELSGPHERFEVVFAGELPDTVCDGQDTFLEAAPFEGLLVASSVHGPGCTKGAECRRWACLPEARRPPECRLSAGSSSW